MATTWLNRAVRLTAALGLTTALASNAAWGQTKDESGAFRSRTTSAQTIAAPGVVSRFGTTGLGLSLADTNGAVTVTGLGQQGPLAGLGLQIGDQIMSVNEQAVSSVADTLSRLLSAAQANLGAIGGQVNMTIARSGVQQTLNVPNTSLNSLLQAQAQVTAAINAAQNNLAASPNTTATTNTTGTTTGTTGTTTTVNNGIPAAPANFAAPPVATHIALPRDASAASSTNLTTGDTAAATTSAANVIQQALQQRAATNAQSGTDTSTASATGTSATATAPALVQGATPATPATPAMPTVSPAIPATPAVPPSNTTSSIDTTATGQAPTGGTQIPMPSTTLTPSGPRIAVPGRGQGQAVRGGGSAAPMPGRSGVAPARTGARPGGGAKARPTGGAARATGGGAAGAASGS